MEHTTTNEAGVFQPLCDLAKTDGFDPEAALKRAWIDPEGEIEPPPVVLSIGGRRVFTLGNLSLIIGKAKSMKTFWSMLPAAKLSGADIEKIDVTLGPDEKAVFFDSEQTRHDVKQYQDRIKRMAGQCKMEIYELRPHSPNERKLMIEYFLRENTQYKLAFIDGIRDLVTDINSPEQATEMATWLLKLTGELNIHIACVLHQNKGDTNARGHLGSELVNKAETTISVTKDKAAGFSVVEAEYTRSLEFEPFAFFIDENGLPQIIDDWQDSTNEPKKADHVPTNYDETWHRDVIQDAIKIETKPTYNRLVQALKVVFQEKGLAIGDNKVINFLTYYKKEGLIKANGKEGTKNCIYEYAPIELPF